MKNSLFILLVSLIQLLSSSLQLQAQIENVIVETYYVSDANDAQDTTGGRLEQGSKTYRIFIDMAEGTILKKIYGDANHPLIFTSSTEFFNNTDRGTSYGKDINDKKLNENTLALDTWVTLGLATKKHTGVLKAEDTDGTILFDGNRKDGLLLNADPFAGIPLNKSDGLMIANKLPTSWASNGFREVSATEDSTIFGEFKKGSEFISHNAGLQNSGVTGLTQENIVLVAQLTTKGDITFEINIEVEITDESVVKTVKYVANDDILLSGEKVSSFLKYPPTCGCKDPDFAEYKPIYACNNPDSCRTHIIFGCTDPNACNYDPQANYNVADLCCYPGNCNDRDISLVCPQLGKNEIRINLYPNPVNQILKMDIEAEGSVECKYIISDFLGREIITGHINRTGNLDVSKFRNGMYFLRIISENSISEPKIIVKN